MKKRTKSEITNSILLRRTAWESAVELVIPIVEHHGLEPYKVNQVVFTTGSTMTKVDQNIDHIRNVADWLLEPIEGV